MFFWFMLLAHIEPSLEACGPEEKHVFRPHHRLEKYLATAGVVVDKLLSVNVPVWIVSLDLPKTFDWIEWAKLWFALTEHGVSERLVWMMQCFYHNQHDRVQCGTEVSADFEIKTGVRQGCVLSPGFFTSVLSMGHPRKKGQRRTWRCRYWFRWV